MISESSNCTTEGTCLPNLSLLNCDQAKGPMGINQQYIEKLILECQYVWNHTGKLNLIVVSNVSSLLVGLLSGVLVGVGILLVYIRLARNKRVIQPSASHPFPIYENININPSAELQLQQNVFHDMKAIRTTINPQEL